MDRGHSQLIVVLLAGIFAVLLFGREAVAGSLSAVFWGGLLIVIPIAIIWAIFSLLSYLRRQIKQEFAESKAAGLPWLYNFVAWPGIIGNFAVFGLAAYWRYFDNSCHAITGDCLHSIPYWWVPVTLLLGSMPISFVEQTVHRLRTKPTIDRNTDRVNVKSFDRNRRP